MSENIFNDINIEEFDNLFSLMYIMKGSLVRSGFGEDEAMDIIKHIITYQLGASQQ